MSRCGPGDGEMADAGQERGEGGMLTGSGKAPCGDGDDAEAGLEATDRAKETWAGGIAEGSETAGPGARGKTHGVSSSFLDGTSCLPSVTSTRPHLRSGGVLDAPMLLVASVGVRVHLGKDVNEISGSLPDLTTCTHLDPSCWKSE
jgi:hypothetical protein